MLPAEGLYILTVTNINSGCSATDTVAVTSNDDLPALIPLPDTVLTCAHPAIEWQATLPSTGDFTAQWCRLDNVGTPIPATCITGTSLLVSEAGSYQFTAVNTQTGCSNQFVVDVTIDTLPPLIDAGNTDTLYCNIDNLILTGSGPAASQVIWSGPTAATLSHPNELATAVDMPGWYYFTLTAAANGCVATDSVWVATDNAAPVVNAGRDTLVNCLHPTVRLFANGNTESGLTTWEWSSPDGIIESGMLTSEPVVAAAGIYIVTLTDGISGCSSTDTLWVNADFNPPAALVTNVQNFILNCYQDTLLLDGQPSSTGTGAPPVYNWQVYGSGSLFPTLDAPTAYTDRPGEYALIVTDSQNGCRDTMRFEVTTDFQAPNLVLDTPIPLDCIDTLRLLQPIVPSTPEGYAFEWQLEEVAVGFEYALAASTPGVYTLVLTSLSNGCSRTESVTLDIAAMPPAVAIAPPLALDCTRTQVILDGSASEQGSAITYQWLSTDGQIVGNTTQSTTTAGSIGTYILEITNNENGCTARDSVTVSVSEALITSATLAVEGPNCQDELSGSIAFTNVQGGTPPFLYSINGFPATQTATFDDLSPADYLLQVQDAAGCEWDSVVTIAPLSIFTLTLGPDTTILLGDVIELLPQADAPVVSWQWNAPGLLAPDADWTPFVAPLETQYVLLSATSEDGCIATDTLRIYVEKRRQYFIPTAFSPNGDGYNDYFNIYLGQDVKQVALLRIFSRWGNMVYEQSGITSGSQAIGWDGTLWGKPLNAGVFVYYATLEYLDGKVETITGELLLVR
ncbi:MAG: gliding motility-associated C-terminal domain-containing protein [Saprospiraceae bacterium]